MKTYRTNINDGRIIINLTKEDVIKLSTRCSQEVLDQTKKLVLKKRYIKKQFETIEREKLIKSNFITHCLIYSQEEIETWSDEELKGNIIHINALDIKLDQNPTVEHINQ